MADQPSYASPVQPMVASRTSGKAIASLVLGLVLCIPLLSSVLAVLFAIGGIRATRDPYVRGRGMAIAGLVLGLCGIVLWGVVGALTGFLIVASGPPRAVFKDFAKDLAADDVPAASKLCEASISPADLDHLHTYIAPFGAYVDQTCTGVNLRPGSCELSGFLRFNAGDHPYTATMSHSGATWKVLGFHVY